jgi:phosphoglucomutase/phosphomannomutase
MEAAAQQGLLSQSAAANIRRWLTEPWYQHYAADVAQHIQQGQWQKLNDVFWTVIPFGTGGRRGPMYPIGCNAINDRTIGESAQGLADYVRRHRAGGTATAAPAGAAPPRDEPLACALAYDTRHNSRRFAELCAGIMVANGFIVYFLDGYRSTPALSVAVRLKQCDCGIMVTASHNPPADNAVKVYWSTGGQLVPPHDKGVIDEVTTVTAIRQIPFAQAVESGKVIFCQEEVDRAYLAGILAQSRPGPRDVRILYTPLHGVGALATCAALQQAGFHQVEVFSPHATPDGSFPNVPEHIANPEEPKTFIAPIEHARQYGHELVLSTDPDADRLGVAAPLVPGGDWKTLTGNQIGALLAQFILQRRQAEGSLTPQHYVVKTLVTTDLIRCIADAYRVRTFGDLLVGFKWIAEVIDRAGPELFVFGTEESHGYQVGTYTRDKDGAVAALLIAELAAECQATGITLHQQLDALFLRYGCHLEKTASKSFPGEKGMRDMQSLMARLREHPPRQIAGLPVRQCRDYLNQLTSLPDGQRRPLQGPVGDLLFFDLAPPGNCAAVRPSGTEPKVKFYLFVRETVASAADLPGVKQMLEERLARLGADLASLAAAVQAG